MERSGQARSKCFLLDESARGHGLNGIGKGNEQHEIRLSHAVGLLLDLFPCASDGLHFPGSGADITGVKQRPNVLFLAVDDLNDWIGTLGGHPQVKTPNLDRLLSRSVVFENAHCAAPVCSASRHALFSGLRPSTTGWYSNSSKSLKNYLKTLGKTIPLPTQFRNQGYTTMAAGKVFHKGTSDIKEYQFWDESRPRYEWPKRLSSRGHGYQGKTGGHFYPFPKDGGAVYQHYQEGVNGQSLCWGALGASDIPPEGMPDEQIADWAVQRLSVAHEKPFFMAIGFIRPHVPYTAPRKYFDLYPLDSIVMPEVPERELDDIPLWGKAMAYGTIQGGDHFNVQKIGDGYWREMVRAYLACVSFVDAQAGKVLDALENGPMQVTPLWCFGRIMVSTSVRSGLGGKWHVGRINPCSAGHPRARSKQRWG